MQRYVFSKLKWWFSIYNLTETWVSENLDNVINRYYRKWLHFPVSGNITHLTLPKNNLGLNIKGRVAQWLATCARKPNYPVIKLEL